MCPRLETNHVPQDRFYIGQWSVYNHVLLADNKWQTTRTGQITMYHRASSHLTNDKTDPWFLITIGKFGGPVWAPKDNYVNLRRQRNRVRAQYEGTKDGLFLQNEGTPSLITQTWYFHSERIHKNNSSNSLTKNIWSSTYRIAIPKMGEVVAGLYTEE